MKSSYERMVFVDTSALYALADTADKNHNRAKNIFKNLLEEGEDLIIHNYIIVETTALLQHRLGFVVAERFLHDSSQFIIQWIDGRTHENAASLLKSLEKRRVSFVDCTSFVIMKERGVQRAFAFDEDFSTQGFSLIEAE